MQGRASAAFDRANARSIGGKVVASRVYPEFFRVGPDDRLVDLGCGTGPQLVTFARRVAGVVGVEIQPERLELAGRLIRAHRIENAELLRADVTRLPLRDGAFDCAIAIDVIEHLDEPERLVGEARRVLGSDGRFLVTVPAFYDRLRYGALGAAVARLKGRDEYFRGELSYDDHRAPRSTVEWEAMFRAGGFVVARAGATTLFPPLHRYGVPRFWFSVTPLRRTFTGLGRLPGLRRLGQAIMYDLRRD
jgi:SAM-dependent methyltransferase